MRSELAIFALCAGLGGCAPRLPAPAPEAAEPVEEQATDRERLAEASVTLMVLQQFYNGDHVSSLEGTGSGFLVDLGERHAVATAAHVVLGATAVQARHGAGYRFEVTGLLGVDRKADVALLAVDDVPEDVPALTLAQADPPSLGDEVLIVSSPLALDTTVSFGTVSALRPERRAIQLAAGVSPGSSGGMVVAEDGRLLGVVRSKSTTGSGGENITLIAPAHYLAALADEPAAEPLMPEPDPEALELVQREKLVAGSDSPFADHPAAAYLELEPASTGRHVCATAGAENVTVALAEVGAPVGSGAWRVGTSRACASFAADQPVAVWVGTSKRGQRLDVSIEQQR